MISAFGVEQTVSKADPTHPASSMPPGAAKHMYKLQSAASDPWDKHGGVLSNAIHNAHKDGMPHTAIAHYSGKPLADVKAIVSHLGGVAKANDNPKYASPQRLVVGALAPGTHGLVRGRKGYKLRAAGHELGGAVAGGAVAGPPGGWAGGAAGTAVAHRKGYYKPDNGDQRHSPIFGSEKKKVAKGEVAGGMLDTWKGMSRTAKLGTAAFPGVLAAGAAKKKMAPAQQSSTVGKKYDWHNTRNNSRKQNVAAGAAGGAVGAGAVGAAVGGTGGAMQARAGAKSLRAIGAGMSPVRSAAVTATHAARTGGKGAAAFGTLGAGYGALLGATERAKRKRKAVAKSAFGVPLSKARTQDLPDNTSPSPMATSRAIRKPTPPKQGVTMSRVDPDATATVPPAKLAKSAFGVQA